MTTTDHLQNGPGSYNSPREASNCPTFQTNKRYAGFNQIVFHAGDPEQFSHFRYRSLRTGTEWSPDLSQNVFRDHEVDIWDGYRNITPETVTNTFNYIFYKLKKGIYVKITDNHLEVFLPFSNAVFTNEWAHMIRVDPKRFDDIKHFLAYVAKQGGHRFTRSSVNGSVREWYANNCLVRSEYPTYEGDTNVCVIKDMLGTLCRERVVPDSEFFVNRRDFPLLTRDGTEPYNHIWGTVEKKLVSHAYSRYAPILSLSTTGRFADVLYPTPDDWTRIRNKEGTWFPGSRGISADTPDIPWEERKPTAVFRGASTGAGTTIQTNARLKAAHISAKQPPCREPLLDAGITTWNLRPRKLEKEIYLQTIEVGSLGFGLARKLSPRQQARYKYVLNLEGHVRAYRLARELGSGSVVLLQHSNWKLWFTDLLIPYKHYVPVDHDLGNLMDQIKWCRENDEECEKIKNCAREFYITYLGREGVLDHLQWTLTELYKVTGRCMYSWTELPQRIGYECVATTRDIHSERFSINRESPVLFRNTALYRGLQEVINGDTDHFDDLDDVHFTSKTSRGYRASLGGVQMFVKTTKDSQKSQELIHEAFVGTRAINDIARVIPNFAYTFGSLGFWEAHPGRWRLVTEFIPGQTLRDYLAGSDFEMEELVFILLQIAVALEVAQNAYLFVHWDLAPWNIVLMPLENPHTYDYPVAPGRIYRLKTSLVPVMIDFGKSHIVHERRHHGFLHPYTFSESQDLRSLITLAMHVVSSRDLSAQEREVFTLLSSLVVSNPSELRLEHKYSALTDINRVKRGGVTVSSFIRFVHKKLPYQFPFGRTNTYTPPPTCRNPGPALDYLEHGKIDVREYRQEAPPLDCAAMRTYLTNRLNTEIRGIHSLLNSSREPDLLKVEDQISLPDFRIPAYKTLEYTDDTFHDPQRLRELLQEVLDSPLPRVTSEIVRSLWEVHAQGSSVVRDCIAASGLLDIDLKKLALMEADYHTLKQLSKEVGKNRLKEFRKLGEPDHLRVWGEFRDILSLAK